MKCKAPHSPLLCSRVGKKLFSPYEFFCVPSQPFVALVLTESIFRGGAHGARRSQVVSCRVSITAMTGLSGDLTDPRTSRQIVLTAYYPSHCKHRRHA